MRAHRNKILSALVMLMMVPASTTFANAETTTETIVFLRHGEKPEAGLGQLNCQGLNRALALPQVIAKNFGQPDAVFAPNPAVQKSDSGIAYDYVRPLATIEPTAIVFGLPIHADIGFDDLTRLQLALEDAQYKKSLIVVAWEHKLIEPVVRALLKAHGGDETSVPQWDGADFDSLYTITITRNGSSETAHFSHGYQGLNSGAKTCPQG